MLMLFCYERASDEQNNDMHATYIIYTQQGKNKNKNKKYIRFERV